MKPQVSFATKCKFIKSENRWNTILETILFVIIYFTIFIASIVFTGGK